MKKLLLTLPLMLMSCNFTNSQKLEDGKTLHIITAYEESYFNQEGKTVYVKFGNVIRSYECQTYYKKSNQSVKVDLKGEQNFTIYFYDVLEFFIV